MKATIAAALVLAVATQPAKPLETLLAELSTYLDAYEPQLSTVVAEERLVQEINPLRRINEIQQRRVLISDVAFTRLPGDGLWLGYRDVRLVDNRDVARKGPSLVELFSDPTRNGHLVARDVVWTSARWNLGAERTTNMPALPLELMLPRNRDRFSFELRGAETLDGVRVTRVAFRERARPALIKSPNGRIEFITEGTIDIEPVTGRLWRADIKARQAKTREEWRYSVTFALDKTVEMLVPVMAREEFLVRNGKGTGVAHYSKFRRFTTSARILPQ